MLNCCILSNSWATYWLVENGSSVAVWDYVVNTGSSRNLLDGGLCGLCLRAEMGRDALHLAPSRSIAFHRLPGNHNCSATGGQPVMDSGANASIFMWKASAQKKQWGVAGVVWWWGVANGSEVCRLKSVDNCGLALPSPSGSLTTVWSLPPFLPSSLLSVQIHANVWAKSIWVMFIFGLKKYVPESKNMSSV